MKRLICIVLIGVILTGCGRAKDNTSDAPEIPSVPPSQTVSAVISSPEPSETHSFVIPELKKFKSGGKGETVTKNVTTGDVELFFTLTPEKLVELLGGEYDEGISEDFGYYYIYDYLGIGLYYDVDETDAIDDIKPTPQPPLEQITVNEPQFEGITSKNNFNEVMKVLGKMRVLCQNSADGYYYVLLYDMGNLQFEFASNDEKASDGIRLSIYPRVIYDKYYPIDVNEIDLWFCLPKDQLVGRLGSGYTNENDDSGIKGVYNSYEYKEKGISLYFEGTKLVNLYLDGRYRIGAEKEAKTFNEVEKILGKGKFQKDDPGGTLTYAYKNFILQLSSLEEDGFNYSMDMRSIIE